MALGQDRARDNGGWVRNGEVFDGKLGARPGEVDREITECDGLSNSETKVSAGDIANN